MPLDTLQLGSDNNQKQQITTELRPRKNPDYDYAESAIHVLSHSSSNSGENRNFPSTQ